MSDQTNRVNQVQLEKAHNPLSIWALAAGTIIGFGAFVMPPEFLEAAGPLGVTLGFIIGAAIMMVVGFNISAMVKRYPVAGGQFAYAKNEFGSTHAYICGWMLLLCYVSLISMNATALGILGQHLMPEFFTMGYLYTIAGWDVYLPQIVLSLVCIVLFGVFNRRGGNVAGRIQLVLTLMMVGGIFLIFFGILASPVSSVANLYPAFANEQAPWGGIIAIVALAPWLFVGFDTVSQSAEEFRFSSNKTLFIILLAIISGALMYTMVTLGLGMVWPWQEMVAAQHVWAIGTAMEVSVGTVGVAFLAIAICMGILTGVNGFYLAGSRLMLAMSRENIVPKRFGAIHKRYKTPHLAIILILVVSVIAPFFGRVAIGWVVSMCAVGTAIAYFYTCAAAYKAAKREGKALGKCMALLGALLSFGILLLLLVPGSPGAMERESWVALLVWIILGVVVYIRRTGRERHPRDGG